MINLVGRTIIKSRSCVAISEIQIGSLPNFQKMKNDLKKINFIVLKITRSSLSVSEYKLYII